MIPVDKKLWRMEKKVRGRVAAQKIMRDMSATRKLIREDKVAQVYSAIQTSQTIGMQILYQRLRALVEKRIITT